MSLLVIDQFNLPRKSESGKRVCVPLFLYIHITMTWIAMATINKHDNDTQQKQLSLFFFLAIYKNSSLQLLLSTFNRLPGWTQALGQCLMQSAAGCPGKWRKMTERCGKTRAVTHPVTPPGFFPAGANLGNIHLGKMKNSCSCPASAQDNIIKAMCGVLTLVSKLRLIFKKSAVLVIRKVLI